MPDERAENEWMMTSSPWTLSACLIGAAMGCVAPEATGFDAAHAEALRDSVEQFAQAVARDVSDEGPSAWLRYFESSPHFFMASDGQMVFPSYDSAAAFVAVLANEIADIQLAWTETRVEPLAPGLAILAASYEETLTDTAGISTAFGGYLTGVAANGAVGWRLRSAHWSSPVAPN